MAVGPAAAAASRPTTPTTSSTATTSHHDALLCIGTGDEPRRPEALPLRRPGLLREGRRRDARSSSTITRPRSRNTLEIAERCDARARDGQVPPARVPGAARAPRARRCCESRRVGRAARSGSGSRRTSRSPAQHGEYGERMRVRARRDPDDGLRRLLPDRRRLHRLRAQATASRSGPGRGSSAGSLVAYSLGITGVDPIEYDIIFERFLNPERISMPDIDVDFCMRGRDQVIRYVAEKYDEPEADDGRARRADHHLRDAAGASRRSATSGACSACPTATSTASRS